MNNKSNCDTKILLDRVFTLTECFLFLAIFFVLAWYFEMIQGANTYGWYSKLIMILLGFIGIFLHKKPGEYGLVPKNWRFSLKWGAYIFLLFIGLSFLTILISILLSIANLEVDPRTLVVDFIWYFIFVGFAEELFFRGYVQSRLNEVFTHKYDRILGVEFKWSKGTLITGVALFGVPHILTGINPFTGRAVISPIIVMVTLFACFLGVILGVLREKTGGVVLPTILHSLIDFTVYGVGRIVGIVLSNIATGIAIFLFFAFFFQKILKEKA